MILSFSGDWHYKSAWLFSADEIPETAHSSPSPVVTALKQKNKTTWVKAYSAKVSMTVTTVTRRTPAKHRILYIAWMKQLKKTAAVDCTVARSSHPLFKFSGNCPALKQID